MYCHDLEVRTLVRSDLRCIVLLSKVVLEPKVYEQSDIELYSGLPLHNGISHITVAYKVLKNKVSPSTTCDI